MAPKLDTYLTEIFYSLIWYGASSPAWVPRHVSRAKSRRPHEEGRLLDPSRDDVVPSTFDDLVITMETVLHGTFDIVDSTLRVIDLGVLHKAADLHADGAPFYEALAHASRILHAGGWRTVMARLWCDAAHDVEAPPGQPVHARTYSADETLLWDRIAACVAANYGMIRGLREPQAVNLAEQARRPALHYYKDTLFYTAREVARHNAEVLANEIVGPIRGYEYDVTAQFGGAYVDEALADACEAMVTPDRDLVIWYLVHAGDLTPQHAVQLGAATEYNVRDLVPDVDPAVISELWQEYWSLSRSVADVWVCSAGVFIVLGTGDAAAAIADTIARDVTRWLDVYHGRDGQ